MTYSPVTQGHVGEGMPLGAICAAAVEWSDNTAGNLMLGTIGGPEGLTQYVRSLGDPVTRLDRTEPTLNTAIPGDERDTTSPQAMIANLKRILLGGELSAASRKQLETWLIDDRVSAKRIRAGLPPTWRAGDKTGSGDNGTANTIAILWPPAGPPILAAVYYTGSSASADVRNGVHAEIGRIVAETFPGRVTPRAAVCARWGCILRDAAKWPLLRIRSKPLLMVRSAATPRVSNSEAAARPS